MWGGLLIEYHTAQAMVALGLALAMVLAGWQLAQESKKTHPRQSTAVRTSMQVNRARMISIMRLMCACTFGIVSEHTQEGCGRV